LLDPGCFLARIHTEIVATPSPEAPTGDDATKRAVRDLLRHGGFKPSGRSKPASEYLVAAFAEGRWPTVSPLVDLCNVASLRSGLPISVVDLDKTRGDLAIQIAPAGTSYVFNPSGQVIDASGLVCLYDAEGPTGTPVKDAQRTKTDAATKNLVVVIWGTRALPGRTAETVAWYRDQLAPYAVIDLVEIDIAVTSDPS
jgi:DNA/RNA-binding domain of Phe-tRNA-synthetase-like protein